MSAIVDPSSGIKFWQKELSEGTITVQFNAPIGKPLFEVIERKGWGHPDKLADDLAEKLSTEYAKYTKDKCSAILHHNFDKLCLLGGCSEVSFGKAKVVKPIRVLVNGRATLYFNDQELHIDSLLRNVCYQFFKERLPLLDPTKDLSIELNISTASSPGRVFLKDKGGKSDRHKWFSPKSLEDLPERKQLYANDTSIGTGYAPLSIAEHLVFDLVEFLSKPKNIARYLWMGTDVKVMAFANDNQIDIIACVPQVAQYVKNKEEYIENMNSLHKLCDSFVKEHFPEAIVTFTFNARDKIESNELYLTAIGSSIESGDEGVVGRGNRVNGLITPMRPMNVEGVNGKNPVYHVGKLYNVLAQRIASQLNQKYNQAVVVNLISRTGGDLLQPWKIVVQLEKEDIAPEELVKDIENLLLTIPSLTEEIIHELITLS